MINRGRGQVVRSMWGPENGERPPPNPVNDAVFADVHLEAVAELHVSAKRVWDLLAEPGQIGRFSPECVHARWIEGHDQARVGARFEGTNRQTAPDGTVLEWTRPCTVTVAERPSRYVYLAHDRWDQPATEWSFTIQPLPAGCRVVQSMRLLPGGLPGIRVAADADPGAARAILDDRLPQLRAGMRDTLRRIKEYLES